MAAQVKVCVRGIDLLPPRLNGGPVGGGNAAESGVYTKMRCYLSESYLTLLYLT